MRRMIEALVVVALLALLVATALIAFDKLQDIGKEADARAVSPRLETSVDDEPTGVV